MGDSSGTNPPANTGAGIEELVERFERNIDAYRRQKYNETLVRREFIDPMFAALGWDIDNRAGYAEAYKDVIHEDAIKVGGATKAPDYCFRVGGTRKFFVEAKKPSVDIARETSPAYQLRRYGWSAKLPLSILTDFEEFAVYDCRIRPKQGDKASIARTMYFTFDNYVEQWGNIAAIFAKEAVLQGSFDKYVIGSKKRGTAEVDAEFLREIEKWRAALARNIARQNSALGVREINFAVQRTIDRIIFLRMCEARGAEQHGALQALTNGIDVYGRLMQMFRAADDRYNSGLFHFNAESGRDHSPDTLTPALRIDDKVLKDIFNGLYYPTSPYEFSVLPADILGNVYEQFLGKVIHLTKTHQARVEEKPEIKKAGGVYYTPKYIVDYIVRHTVGKLIGAAAEDAPVDAPFVDAASSRVDQSGGDAASTVAGPKARGELLESVSPGGAQDGSPARKAGERIAPQKRAPEGRKKQAPKTPRQIAKLKILDPACGSGSFLVGAYKYLLDYHRDWYRNEKNGGPEKHTKEIYQGHGGQWYLTTAAKKRILLNNIYGVDIDSQAVEVTKLNLLLCVLENENQNTIGQMSLIHERILPDLSDNIKCGNSLIGSDFYDGQQLTLFDTEAQYKINAFDWESEFPEVFKGKNPGFDAVIGNPPYGATFQGDEAVYMGEHFSVFRGVKDMYTCFIERGMGLLKRSGVFSFIIPSSWLGGPDYLPLRLHLLEHSTAELVLLPFDVFATAYIDTVILVMRKNPPGDNHIVKTYTFGKRDRLSKIDISADTYQDVRQGDWAIGENCKFVLDPQAVQLLSSLSNRCPRTIGNVMNIKRGVLFNKELLTDSQVTEHYHRYFEGHVYRYVLDLIAERWVEFGDRMKERPKEFFWFQGERLLLRRLVNRQQRLMCTFADEAFVTNKNLYSILPALEGDDVKPLLGVLNSRLISFLYIRQVTQAVKDDFPQVTMRDLRALPFPSLESTQRHTLQMVELVELVERMLGLQKSLPPAKTDHDKTLLQRQITATDKQIDQLVYELYGLSDDEIGIVEGAG